MKVCCKEAGAAPNDLSQLRLRVLRKTRSILAVPSHPLEEEFELLLSGRRYRPPRCRTDRFKNSFVIAAASLLNEWPVTI